MNNLVIPSSPNWYESRILACSVDNTVVYGTRNEIVMINPIEKDKAADVKVLPPAHYGRILSVDVNQNWAPKNKLIVSAGDEKTIHLWDAETCKLKASNNVHSAQTDKLVGSVFMGTDKIVSASENGFVSLWRFNSMETTTFKDLFSFKVRIATLSACPHVTWMVAFGLQCGLIIIADLRRNGRIVYKLRSHDKNIVSLAWCPTPFNIFPKKVSVTARLKCIAEKVTDEDSANCNETNQQDKSGNDDKTSSEILDNFLDECESLIDKIQGVNNAKLENGNATTVESTSTSSTKDLDTSSHILEEQFDKTEDSEILCKTKEDIVISEEVPEVTNPIKEYLLASSARGGSIVIWRVGTDGRKETELFIGGNRNRKWRSGEKAWISLCWITPDILLSSSPSAELLQWDLLTSSKKKLIHHDHNKNLFVIAAPIVVVPEWNNNIKRQDLFAWSLGQERYLLNTSLQADRTLVASYPTIGGNVFTICESPLDPTRLAVGIGDNTVKIWDLSRPHQECITMSNLWQKIQSKVLAVAWHPTKETILAYATAEGRIGTVNTSTNNPTLLCQYFHNAVYNIQWGPMEGKKETLGLYAVGEGKLVLYNTFKESEDPKLIETPKGEYIHCLAWKEDYSLFACGTKTGSIILYDISLNHIRTTYSEYKSIYCIVWHPLATKDDDDVSSMSSCFAIASSCTSVVVFETSDEKSKVHEKSILAVLNRHTKPVRCICWSPYKSSTLVSGGDDGVVLVWDVLNETVLATFLDHHLEPVLTVLWSPLHEHFVMSAGKDNCIRVWNINEHKPMSDEEITNVNKQYVSFRFERRKVIKEANGDAEGDGPKVQRHVMLNITAKVQNTPETVLNDCVRLFKMLNPDDNVDVDGNDGVTDQIDVLKLFGDQTSMMELLCAEQKNHESKGQLFYNQHIDLWKGDIADMVKNSISRGKVTPWLINLAPMVSTALWKEACEVYAKKLMEDAKSNPMETVSYLLICHKVEEAIEVLCNGGLFREALALAKCRRSKNDPIVNQILEKWATFCIINGAYEISAQCFIALGRYEEAAKALFRRTNLDALKFSTTLAEKSGNKDLINACVLRYNNFKNSGEGDAGGNNECIEKETIKDESEEIANTGRGDEEENAEHEVKNGNYEEKEIIKGERDDAAERDKETNCVLVQKEVVKEICDNTANGESTEIMQDKKDEITE